MPNTTSPRGIGVSRRIVIFILLLFGLVLKTSYNIYLFHISNLSRGDDNIANTNHEFINVAKGKFATQSSVFQSYGADLAVDGDIRTYSHTKYGSAWIQIDLQNSYHVQSITVLNRWCKNHKDGPGCLCRLSNAKLSLLDKDGVIVETREFENTCGVDAIVEEFNDGCLFEIASSKFSACLPTAQKVKIESTTEQPIQLFEVQVMSPGIYYNESEYNEKTMGKDENLSTKESKKAHQCNLIYRPIQDASCQIQTPLTTPSSCRPNYFIAGTRKGGTTSLHTCMAAHPHVYPFKLQGGPQDGESFAALDGSQSMYNAFVKNLDIPENQIVGDSTVSRIIDDGLINFAQHSCNNSKILLLLRDPVERCYSQMQMRVHLGHLSQESFLPIIQQQLKEFQNEVNKHPEVIAELWEDPAPLFGSAKNCMYEGAYVVHLRRLLHKFPKERVRIYWSDDFFADPAGVLRDALKFVGVNPDADNFDPINVTTAKFNTKNKNQDLNLNETMSMELRKEMAKTMKPFDEQLVYFLGEVPPWKYNEKTMGGDENLSTKESKKADTTPMSISEHQIPIWMYWKQGLDHLLSVKEGQYKLDSKCVMGMKSMHRNTNFTVIVVTDADIDDYAPTTALLLRNKTLSSIEARVWSDLVRLELLYKHGGIWADTSVCPLVPFDNVIDKYLGTNMGHEYESFYAPHLNEKIRDPFIQNVSTCHRTNFLTSKEFRLASTWFMAVSSPGNSLIYEWYKILKHHMTTLPNPNTPYFLSHCSLTQAIMYNETVAKIWESTRERESSLFDQKLTPMPCFDFGWVKDPNQLFRCSLVKKPHGEDVIAFIDQKYSSL